MDQASDFFNKKNIIALLVLGIIALAIPLGVTQLREQKQFFSKAAEAGIAFAGDNVACDQQGNCTTTTANVEIEMTSPFGPPDPSLPTPTPTTVILPTNTPTPTAPAATVAPTNTPTPTP